MTDRTAAIGGCDLFRGFGPDAVADLCEAAIELRRRRGTTVFVQGDAGDRCYVIASGAVRISAYQPDGRETVLAVLGPGDVFGELALFDDAPRSADATVVDDAQLLSLDRAALVAAVRSYPDTALTMLAALSRRLRSANELFSDVAMFDIAGRVARRLAELARVHGVPTEDGMLIDLSLSQEAIAQMVGATRESVNKAIAGLVRRGLVVKIGRRYLVPDVDELRARAR